MASIGAEKTGWLPHARGVSSLTAGVPADQKSAGTAASNSFSLLPKRLAVLWEDRRMGDTTKSDVPSEAVCAKCGCETKGEVAWVHDEEWCHSCADNEAEAAWERHCEDFHDGGCTRFNSLLDQQIAARRLK